MQKIIDLEHYKKTKTNIKLVNLRNLEVVFGPVYLCLLINDFVDYRRYVLSLSKEDLYIELQALNEILEDFSVNAWVYPLVEKMYSIVFEVLVHKILGNE